MFARRPVEPALNERTFVRPPRNVRFVPISEVIQPRGVAKTTADRTFALAIAPLTDGAFFTWLPAIGSSLQQCADAPLP